MEATDLLAEIFPLEAAALPPLTAYSVQAEGSFSPLLGGRLAYRLGHSFPGGWAWTEGHILTDSPVAPVQMQITLDILREEQPALYGSLTSVDEHPGWRPGPRGLAQFVLRARVREHEPALRAALHREQVRIKNARVEREALLSPWAVGDEAALSISIKSHLLYEHPVSIYLATHGMPDDLSGLWVKDRTGSLAGPVLAMMGPMRDFRERLLGLTRRPEMQAIIRSAPDDEPVLRVAAGQREYDYAASALELIIRSRSPQELRQFGITPEPVLRALSLRPDARARLVRAAADVLKKQGLIGGGYNSRTHPQLFQQTAETPELCFGGGRARPYDPQTLAQEFLQHGPFHRLKRFETGPITIGVINTLDEKIDDFIEVLRRQLESGFGFSIALLRERRVRVVSNRNIESALRVIEKENPHIVLAFFNDEPEQDEDAPESTHDHLKSLALGRGIASHLIRRSTVHDPDALPLVIMALLGKTGSLPYVFPEPLPYADYVVGLDIVRRQHSDRDRIVGITRIYRSDGALQRYIVHQVDDLEPGSPLPFVVLQALFPQETLGGKRVIIHLPGLLAQELRSMLARWAGVLGARFYPVEIIERSVPRLYGLRGRTAGQPPRGSALLLSEYEALLVTAPAGRSATSRPLRLRTQPEGPDWLTIRQALHSVLAWTLLHYGRPRPLRLPVTIQYAEELARWLEKGSLPADTEGSVPFWL